MFEVIWLVFEFLTALLFLYGISVFKKERKKFGVWLTRKSKLIATLIISVVSLGLILLIGVHNFGSRSWYEQLANSGTKVSGTIVTSRIPGDFNERLYPADRKPMELTIEYIDLNGEKRSIAEVVDVYSQDRYQLNGRILKVFYLEKQGQLFAASELNPNLRRFLPPAQTSQKTHAESN